MRLFKSEERVMFEQRCLAEYECWNEGAYPYDQMIGCQRCTTHHAVRGCEMPEHNEFVNLAHDGGLHLIPELFAGGGYASTREKIKAGKYLIENRPAILQLRQLYDCYFKQPAKPEPSDFEELPDEVSKANPMHIAA